jgi:hypothetical protein
MTNQTLVQGSEANGCGQTLYKFLGEKECRSSTISTVQAYSQVLFLFFDTLGKTPDEVNSLHVFSYTHSLGLSGRKPSSVTIAACITCLSVSSG